MTKTELLMRIKTLEQLSGEAMQSGISEGLLRASQYCDQEVCRTKKPADLAKVLKKMADAHRPLTTI